MRSTREKALVESSVPLLQVADLSVNFHTVEGTLTAVRNVSFNIDRGETVALVGESGSGKSVTALSILQLLPYPKASHPSGSIRFEGDQIVAAPPAVLQRIRGDRISIIFQEPMTSLNPLHTIEKQVNETLILHKGLRRPAARRRTLELLAMVGIRDPEKRIDAYPHQLSGGQRQRVMIAMALANEPDLLIADEPTTALDVTIQAQILALLGELKTRLGMALLLITHDLGIVRRVADRICVMHAGVIVERGLRETIFNRPRDPYTRRLLDAEPGGAPPAPDPHSREVLRGDQIRVWFPIRKGVLRRTVDHIKAVDDVSVAVRAGHTVGIVGESGSGKTTLALALLRLIESRGRIVFHKRDIQALDGKALKPLRRQMQVVFQDPYGSLSPRLTVAQIVAEGLIAHRLVADATERERRVVDALTEVGLDPATRHRYPHEFSGGQRQRIAIARAMILQPELLVLDEPTSSLDRTVQSQIVSLLKRLQRQHDLAYLFISHDLKVVRALSNYLIVLRYGKVVEHGPAERIFDAPQAQYTIALMRAAFDLEAVQGAALSQ